MTKTKNNEEWFLSLPVDEFLDITRRWNEQSLGIDIPDLDSYDVALNFFRKLPVNAIKKISKTGMDTLPIEAYSALAMWRDLIQNPHRISKIHQSGLKRASDGKNSIVELAKSNDTLKVLYALRDRIAEKLDAGAGTRDTALLSRELGDVLEQIRDYERRQGPKKGTKLDKLMKDIKPKTKVTIDDLDA